ncbi:uncharacterized protein [Temnothorax nylanderi]|uniref:uncharacterized protein n=1 Tax=Temnothorax nylanderi TaxID=102681 RepID=UPI003A8C3924
MELVIYDDEVTDEQVDQELISHEEKYINLKLLGERIIDQRVRPAPAANNIGQALVAPGGAVVHANESHGRLPKIDLPSFSGAYEDWNPFYNTFNSLIHSNTSLNDIQKFHYLKSSLKGEAAEMIASHEISEVHYNDAWTRLKERYDNERLAVQNHIKAIFELPTLRKENSVTLRSILDGTLKHTRALAALRRPTNHWDDLLIHIITSKLDFITIKEWETTVGARELPTFNQLIDFLTQRCQMLEAVARRSLSTSANNNSRPTGPGKVTASHAALTSVKCMHCKGDHQIYQCKSKNFPSRNG